LNPDSYRGKAKVESNVENTQVDINLESFPSREGLGVGLERESYGLQVTGYRLWVAGLKRQKTKD
jgi:hypothetical protein